MILCLLLFGIVLGPAAGQLNFLTWNTNGARWGEVVNYLHLVDVLAIQEAGTLQPQLTQRPHPFESIVRDNANIYVVHVDPTSGAITETQFNGGVTLYRVTVNRITYFLYYYERTVENAGMQALNRDTRKQNMAIISKVRAQEVYVFEPHSRDDDRVDVNRPILGIRLPNYLAFSAHTDPDRRTNEIDATISIIMSYVATECNQSKWILMGDFNAQPNEIQVPPPSNGCYRDVVFPTQATKPQTKRVIDYAICGGPNSLRPFTSPQAVTQGNKHGSDHYPVIIQF